MQRPLLFSNDPHIYVAHYTSWDTALSWILPTQQLKLGPLEATNDPRETNLWSFAFTRSLGSSLTSEGLEALSDDPLTINRILKQGCKVLCVSEDAEKPFKLDFATRAYGKPRMWAQYAGNHTGVCLLLDKQRLHNELETSSRSSDTLLYGQVTYFDFIDDIGKIKFWEKDFANAHWWRHQKAFTLSGEAIVADGLEVVLRRHRQEFARELFFCKTKDWQTETEFRWLLVGSSVEPVYVPIGDALRAVVLGVDFPLNRTADVIDYCVRNGVSVSRIQWYNGIPSVDWFEPEQLGAPAWQDALRWHGLRYDRD